MLGSHHSLGAIFARLNAEYFDGRVDASIRWGRRTRARRPRRSIKLGSYNSRLGLIRVHPALDATWVPDYFVEYVVYHEMLHHIIPVELGVGRRRPHGRDFRRRERLYHSYGRARVWEKLHLSELLIS